MTTPTYQQGRSGRPWKRFRQLVLATYGPWCHLCRKPIDPTLPPRNRRSYTVDHLDPLIRGGAPLDLDRARPAHYGCNSRRGAKPMSAVTKPLITTEDW